MSHVFAWLLDRARERSTWLGITGLLTALGVGLAPDQIEAIISVGMAVGGAVTALTADGPKTPPAPDSTDEAGA